MRTAQEVLDETIDFIMKQGRAVDSDGSFCQYRTEEGRKCAAGYWISDSEYNPKMEGRSLTTLMREQLDLIIDNDVLNQFSNIIQMLQSWHDQSGNWEKDGEMSINGERYLIEMIGRYNLKITNLKYFPITGGVR